MRRPTGKELLVLALLWLLTLSLFWFRHKINASYVVLLIWLIIDIVSTYRTFNAKAYAKQKARQAAANARLERKFGRRYKLVPWLPILFFFATLFLALLTPTLAFPLIGIGFLVLMVGILLVGIAAAGPDPDDP